MKKMFMLLFVLAIASSAHAALIQFKLTVVSTQGIGTIMVFNKTANTPGVVCNGTTPCTFTFKTGTNVAITANSNSVGFAFNGWSPVRGSATACASQTGATCTFTITADSSATAKIDPVSNIKFQVGTGSGTIRVKRGGQTLFDCTNTAPLACSTGVIENTVLTIENIAGPNQQFGSYSNKVGSFQACTTNPCTVTVKGPTNSMVSNFIQIP